MIYDLFIVLFVIVSAPKILWQTVRGKRLCTLRQRFGTRPPYGKPGLQKIWIHAVSVGEIKAAQPLLKLLRQREPTASILVTSTTVTGLEEARRSLSEADLFRFLPLDFSWIMRRWIRFFSPDLLLFVEGDVWPNLIYQAKKAGVKTALVSGKISERSTKRLSYVPFLARRLYFSLDLLSTQNEEYSRRFASLVGRPIQVTGNLKLDIQASAIDRETARRHFSFAPEQIALTLSCTHAPEEKELLETLSPLWKEYPDLVIFLAPRHPERFDEVGELLSKMGFSFCRWEESRKEEQIVLVDAMGKLPICYTASALAIVAGSFSSYVGGHNVLEPFLFGCPVLFGPNMQDQREFARLALASGAAWQGPQQELAQAIRDRLRLSEKLRESAKQTGDQNRGSAQRTFDAIIET